MKVQWYRIKKTYEKPQAGFLAIGPRYPGVLSDDGLTALFTHPGTGRRVNRSCATSRPT
jgi:hypothetical protein